MSMLTESVITIQMPPWCDQQIFFPFWKAPKQHATCSSRIIEVEIGAKWKMSTLPVWNPRLRDNPILSDNVHYFWLDVYIYMIWYDMYIYISTDQKITLKGLIKGIFVPGFLLGVVGIGRHPFYQAIESKKFYRIVVGTVLGWQEYRVNNIVYSVFLVFLP